MGLVQKLRMCSYLWGANVLLCARDEAALEAVADQLRQKCVHPEQRIMTFIADVSQQVQVDQLFCHIEKDLKRLDIPVNHAGIQGPIGPIERNN